MTLLQDLSDFVPWLSLLTICGVIGALIAGLNLSRRVSTVSPKLPLPPGPKGLPLFGSMFDIPMYRPWYKYREWQDSHGDLVYVNVLQQPILIIGSVEVAFDLMERRSSLYSDRPISVLDELTGWNFGLAFMSYGSRWRDARRCFHQTFNIRAVPQYRPIHTREVRAYLERMLKGSGEFDMGSLRTVMGLIIADIVYGVRAQNLSGEYLALAQEATEYLNDSRKPGKYWADFFPFVKHLPHWIPGAASSKLGQRSKLVVDGMINRPFDAVKIDVAKDSPHASMTHTLIRDLQDSENAAWKEKIAREAAGSAYAAAVDTTGATIATCFLAMAMYPEVQRKVQDELDHVVGQGRLPEYDDESHLPYVKAVIMESLRWIPVTPLCVPHRLTSDDEYRGYHLPAGSMIVPNVWSMLRNPSDYPDPETFNPDRFLRDGQIDTSVRDPRMVSFGFGRRICPGRHLADDVMFLACSSILHMFNISGAKDKNGVPIPLSTSATTGFLSYPESLPLLFTPRIPDAEKLLSE